MICDLVAYFTSACRGIWTNARASKERARMERVPQEILPTLGNF